MTNFHRFVWIVDDLAVIAFSSVINRSHTYYVAALVIITTVAALMLE